MSCGNECGVYKNHCKQGFQDGDDDGGFARFLQITEFKFCPNGKGDETQCKLRDRVKARHGLFRKDAQNKGSCQDAHEKISCNVWKVHLLYHLAGK